MPSDTLIWIAFITAVLLMLAADLLIFHRKAHELSIRESLTWSAVWIILALLFSLFIHAAYSQHWYGLGTHGSALHPQGLDGQSAMLLYLTGYLVEKSLSLDNLFVIAIIFTALSIPAIHQHRVLFWGIVGALVMRGAMIGAGVALVQRFHWILYLFGAFLIVTAVRTALMRKEPPPPERNRIIRLVQRFLPISGRLYGQRFFIRASSLIDDDPLHQTASRNHTAAGWVLTPLALALIVVECSDIVFAVDSIPAIFAITTDPFLIFTSNVFAILGLRALFFALSRTLARFHYLQYSLSAILAFVGLKMLLLEHVRHYAGKYLNLYMLGAILFILLLGFLASILRQRRFA